MKAEEYNKTITLSLLTTPMGISFKPIMWYREEVNIFLI